MALDLEEQEKIAELKAWWNKFGNAIVGFALVAAVTFAGYNGWLWYTRNQAVQASAVYETLQGAVMSKDIAKVKEAAGKLFEKYSGSAYAQMAALAAAKANYDAGDARTAKAQLQWAADHAKDSEYRQIARLRLAGILLDENALDDALKQLGGDVSPEFQPAFADRRGDVYVAQKKMAEAKKEYETALEKMKSGNVSYANVVQLKLDGLSTEFAAPIAMADNAAEKAGAADQAAPGNASSSKPAAPLITPLIAPVTREKK